MLAFFQMGPLHAHVCIGFIILTFLLIQLTVRPIVVTTQVVQICSLQNVGEITDAHTVSSSLALYYV